jgi:hypothetical protein
MLKNGVSARRWSRRTAHTFTFQDNAKHGTVQDKGFVSLEPDYRHRQWEREKTDGDGHAAANG